MPGLGMHMCVVAAAAVLLGMPCGYGRSTRKRGGAGPATTRKMYKPTLHVKDEGSSQDIQLVSSRFFDRPPLHNLRELNFNQYNEGPLSSPTNTALVEVRAQKGGGGGAAKGGAKSGKAGKGGTPEALECPKVDGRKCGGYGDCDEGTGFCDCFKGFYGPSCMDDPLSHIAFDLDCARMTQPYVAQVIKAVTGGSCKQFRLVWERLAYHTCTALPGVLCTLYSREKWCSHDPDGACGETLCNSFLANYCQDAFEDVSKLRKAAVRNPEDIAAEEGYGNTMTTDPPAPVTGSEAGNDGNSGSSSASSEPGPGPSERNTSATSGATGVADMTNAADKTDMVNAADAAGTTNTPDNNSDNDNTGGSSETDETDETDDTGVTTSAPSGRVFVGEVRPNRLPLMAQSGPLPEKKNLMQIPGPLPDDTSGESTLDVVQKGLPSKPNLDTTTEAVRTTAQEAAYDADSPEPIKVLRADSATHASIASGSGEDSGSEHVASSLEASEDRKPAASTTSFRFRERRGQSQLLSAVASHRQQDFRKRGFVRPNARGFTWDNLAHAGELSEVLPHIDSGLDAHDDALRAMRQAGQTRTFDAVKGLHNIRAIAATLPEAALLQRQEPGEEKLEQQYSPAAQRIFDKLYDLQRK